MLPSLNSWSEISTLKVMGLGSGTFGSVVSVRPSLKCLGLLFNKETSEFLPSFNIQGCKGEPS